MCHSILKCNRTVQLSYKQNQANILVLSLLNNLQLISAKLWWEPTGLFGNHYYYASTLITRYQRSQVNLPGNGFGKAISNEKYPLCKHFVYFDVPTMCRDQQKSKLSRPSYLLCTVMQPSPLLLCMYVFATSPLLASFENSSIKYN